MGSTARSERIFITMAGYSSCIKESLFELLFQFKHTQYISTSGGPRLMCNLSEWRPLWNVLLSKVGHFRDYNLRSCIFLRVVRASNCKDWPGPSRVRALLWSLGTLMNTSLGWLVMKVDGWKSFVGGMVTRVLYASKQVQPKQTLEMRGTCSRNII